MTEDPIKDQWSQDCFDRLINSRPDELAIDSETSGLKWSDRAFGVSFSWYVQGQVSAGYIDIRSNSHLWDMVKAWILDENPRLLFHNAKFDMHKLGLYPQPDSFEDTCLMTYILNEHYPKGLKVLAEKILKKTTDEADAVKKARKELKLRAEDGYDKLPLEVVAPYAIQDARFTLGLYSRLQSALAKEPVLEKVYLEEKALLLCVAGTEIRGMRINTEYVKQQVIELGDRIIQLEREIAGIVNLPVGDGKKKERVQVGKFKNGNPKYETRKIPEFNPNSPPQLLEYFKSQGIDLESTSEEALRNIDHPLAEALRQLRRAVKMRSTYFMAMLDEVDENGILHPNWNLTVTKTKRFSSSGRGDT